ncbi:hypothetical protein JTB14_010325 [Gonioctena quinquepunctata]|nr:hypothetical protein JTB14_010325 [Gonioctena quinquepunctata]
MTESKAQAFSDSMEWQSRLNEHPDDDLDRELLLKDWAHINGLNPKKAPGYDGNTNRMIKYFPDSQVQSLLNIINNYLRLERFLRRWKHVIVVMIPKEGQNPTFPQNHKSISLLCSSAKLAEKVVLERLDEEVKDINVLPNEHFGFRRAHSTELQVLRLVDDAITSLNVNNSAHIILSEYVKISSFDDDTALLSFSANQLMGVVHLQNELNDLQQWYLEWKINSNPGKTQAISMGRERNNPEREVFVSGREIG